MDALQCCFYSQIKELNVLLLELTDRALDAPIAHEIAGLLGDALLDDLEHVPNEARPKQHIAGEEPRVLGREERGSFYFLLIRTTECRCSGVNK